MPVPSVTFRSELDPIVRKELDQLDGELTGWMLQEHDEDGHHTRITADSVKVEGPVTITGGPLLVNGLPVPGAPAAPLPHHATHEPGGTDPMAVDTIPVIGSLRTLGTGPQQACAGNDARLTNARPPTAHAATHGVGNTDPVLVTALAGYPGGTIKYLRADGTFAAPGGGTVGLGEWQAHPFNAAQFFAPAGMTWTVTAGQVTAQRYSVIGKTLTWTLQLDGTTFGGTLSYYVNILLPGGFLTGAAGQAPLVFTQNAGNTVLTQAYWFASANIIYLVPAQPPVSPTSWVAGAFTLHTTITLEIA